jgi:ankyrin repeat protein
MACRHGNIDVVRCLVNELGADANQESNLKGLTPSQSAAVSGNLDIVRCLLDEFGVDVDKKQ